MERIPALTIVLRAWAEETKLPPERVKQIFENIMRKLKILQESRKSNKENNHVTED